MLGLACLVANGLSTEYLAGQDWPQIMGVHRDGQAVGTPPLAPQWPSQASLAWQTGLGSGYSGPAVAGKVALILHRLGNQEMLDAYDLARGTKLWSASWPASYRSAIDPDNGPRCVPTVAGERVVCYGAAGDVVCVELSSGKIAWQRALRKEFRADDGYFGAGSTPLVMGDTIIVCLGGTQAGVVGLNLRNGETRWTATKYDASYAAPIAVDDRTALVVTRLHTVLLDVSDGKVLAEIPFGSRGPTVNAAIPIATQPEEYLLTANYGVGATLLSTAGRKLTAIFQGSELVSSQYVTPVKVGGRVIAIDGRDDGPPSTLRSIDVAAQKVVWNESGFGTAHLLAVGQQVVAVTKEGEVVLIDGQADEYRELARMQLPPGTYRAPPALAGQQLLVRDTNANTSRSRLLCVTLPTAP